MSNLLSKVHPELTSEWSDKNLPLTPDKITFGSNKKVWWKGACGHEWQTSIKAMTNPDPIPLGEYRGFTLELYFEAREYKVRLKGELGYPVTLGTDTFGNITRLDNAL